jgi:hypothetical protein
MAMCECMLQPVVITRPSALCRYTLGGFYLARYSDSPVGAFDEVCGAAARIRLPQQQYWPLQGGLKHSLRVQLVAVAGLVWNFPGSCAWAARVYVNDKCAAFGLLTVLLCFMPR